MKILENYPLTNLNTFGLKSQARYFAIVKNETDLVEASFFIKNKKIPFFVLGGGSNLLLPDEGFPGLVLKNELVGKDLINVDKKTIRLGCGSGEKWDEVVSFSVKNNLTGLETLSGIPGTVGSSVVQNIGAYGAEVRETVFSVEAFDLSNLSKKKWTLAECAFGYRDSIFKKKENKKYFITKVFFDLKIGGSPNIQYKDVKHYFDLRLKRQPTISEVRTAVLEIRKGKMPDPQVFGNAGSFFKNPIVNKSVFAELVKAFPDMPHFDLPSGQVKIPLAFVLDKICHLKGLKYGRVGLYESQPLVLVNHGEATSEEIKRFAQTVAESVKSNTGLDIDWEVEVI